MTKHDVALDELRRVLNTLTAESKIAADRRVWFGDKIRHDEEQGYTPELKHVKEFAEMDEKVKANFVKIQSIIASMDLLEAEDAKETYIIENMAEGSTTARMELDDRGLDLVEQLIAQLNDNDDECAPTLTIEKAKK